MSRISDEQPVVREVPSRGGDRETVETHPAYAMIGASRVSGHAYLYGSDFDHQAFVSITVRRSETHRNLSRDWHFGTDELIEVHLSEAQWATFVSTMNVGFGVPCTLNHMAGRGVPGIPRPETDRTDTFRAELQERLELVETHLGKLVDLINASTAPAKQKKEQIAQLNMARMNLTPNLAFVARSFGEHMEDLTEKAKIEISAYVQAHVQRAGLAALAGAIPPVQMIEAATDDGQESDQ